MELNEKTEEISYVLGRMFAILEQIQEAVNSNISSTIADRYFNSACATPAVIFPQLLRLKNSHIKVLNRDKPGVAVSFEKQIQSLMGLINAPFPTHLSLEEQGIFMIGYYHQKQKRYTKKEEK